MFLQLDGSAETGLASRKKHQRIKSPFTDFNLIVTNRARSVNAIMIIKVDRRKKPQRKSLRFGQCGMFFLDAALIISAYFSSCSTTIIFRSSQ